MRKHCFLLSILVLSFSLSLPQTLRAQETCKANSTLGAGYVAFTSIYYISAPAGEAGDLLVVGSMSMPSYTALNSVPAPSFINEQFCNPITLAPGIVANAYVPVGSERTGGFGNFTNILFDPTCTVSCPYYYPSGQITSTEIPTVFAWRIPPTQPGPPVYVSTGPYSCPAQCTGGQILKVDGSSGVTSVLYNPQDYSGNDLEGLAVGPDNLIYITDPNDYYIFRLPQTGGTLTTVYQPSCTDTGCSGPDEVQGPSFSTTGQLTFNTEDKKGVWQISFDSSDNPSAPVQVIPPAYGATEGAGTTFNLADELLIVDEYPGDGSPAADVLQQTAPGASSTSLLIPSTDLWFPVGAAVDSFGNIYVASSRAAGPSGTPNISQFNALGGFQSTYVNFPYDDGAYYQPFYLQFDASNRLYVVTNDDSGNGQVWRVDPIGSPPTAGNATLLVDLGYAYSNKTIPNLSGSSAVGVALPGTGNTNSYTTPPAPIAPGQTVTYSYGNIINQTISLPGDANLGQTGCIAVDFQLWNPSVFDTTRLPATPQSPNWSGGTPVPNGTTCTPIAGTGGNCIVVEDLCFKPDCITPVVPHCDITIGSSGVPITLTSVYETQSPQPNPGLIIADDGQNNWANITTGYTDDAKTIKGGTDGLNTDTAIVNLGLPIVSPSFIDFGTVYLGTITFKSVKVTNLLTTPMTISEPFISLLSGGDSHEFVALNLCPKSLAVGKSCTIDIGFFAGAHYNTQTATLSVTDSAPNSPQTVALTATVINPQAHLSAASLSFGKQKEYTSSLPPKPVTLTNTGATTLTITSIAIAGTNPGDFAQTNNCLGSWAAKASCTINVTFTPTAIGLRSGSVVITDNAQNSPQKILLSGTGK